MSDNTDHGRAVRVGDDWDWQRELRERRPGLPLFGIFLILLGVFLALGQFFDVAAIAGSAFFLALGIILIGVWVRERSHGALYLGTFITALALSDVLTGLRIIHGDGWGTLFLGIGFLAIAALRLAGSGGWGWQLVFGVLLTVVGASSVIAWYAGINGDSLTLPVLIVLIGLLIVFRGGRWRGRY